MKNRISVTSLSYLFFVFLFILSIVFREERILFLDNALQTFLLINTQEIEVMAMRYPAVMVRLLPLGGVKLGLGLSWIIGLFSISYVLWQALLLLVAHKLLRNKWWLAATCLSLSLVLGHSFFWCNSELLFGVPLSVLVLGLIHENSQVGRFREAMFFTLIGSILLVFYHPQSLLVLILGLLFLIPLERKSWKLYLYPLMVSGILLLKSMLIENWYDTMKFEELLVNLKNFYPSIFSTESSFRFLDYTGDMLLLPFAVFIITTAVLLFQKKWYKSFVLVSGSLFSLTLFHLANAEEMTPYYAEAGYLVWSGILAIAFTMEVLRELRYAKLIFAGLLVISIFKIVYVSPFYKERVRYVESLCLEHEGTKVLIPEDTLPSDLFMLNWGLPFETALISNIRSEIEGTVVVPAVSAESYQEYIDGSEFINGMGSALELTIDTSYFQNLAGPYLRIRSK